MSIHSYLRPTLIPVQIWPEPQQKQKKELQEKSESPKSRVSLTIIKKGSLNKFYKFIVVFAIASAILSNGYFIFTKLTQQNSTPKTISMTFPDSLFQTIINPNTFNDPPVRLKIPSINVDASIQQVGQTPEGAMDVPNNTSDVGWYKFGPVPGQKGTAIIDAHVDDPNGLPATFSQLHVLKEGDSIIIENNKNKSIYFAVKKVMSFPVDTSISDILNENDGGAHLSLITCSGIWDMNKKTYTERLMVFADMVNP